MTLPFNYHREFMRLVADQAETDRTKARLVTRGAGCKWGAVPVKARPANDREPRQ